MSSSVVLFIANNTLAVWLALRWGRRLLPRADAAARALATTVLFVSITLGCLQLLGFTGLLTAANVAALLAALTLIEALVPGRQLAPTASQPAATLAKPGKPRRPSLAGLLLTGLCLWCAWVIVTTAVTYGWDTQTYHAVAPAWWYQQGGLDIQPFNYQGYYPLNVELHTFWFLLPFGTDAHVTLAMFSWVALIVGAMAVHGRILGQSPLFTACVALAFLVAPPVQERLVYYTSNDLSVGGMLLALLALGWLPERDDDATGRALLCGLAGGAALGMKPTTAPFVLFVGLWWIWRLGWRRTSLRPVLAYGLAVLSIGSAWYLRNLIVTGNPLFPAALGPFEGPLDAGAQRATSLLPVLLEKGGDPEFWTDLLGRYLDWPLPLGLAAVLGYLVGAVAWFRTGDRLRRAHLFMLLLCGVVFLVLYPLQPFSATANRPGGPFLVYIRYILFGVLVGLMLLPCLRLKPRDPAEPSGRSSWPTWLLPAAVALASLGLGLDTPARARAAAEQLGRFGPGNLAGVWAAIDELPDGARVAVLSPDPPSHTLVYPLFGRRLQLEPVAIYADGRPRQPLHEVWRERDGGWWWEFAASSPEANGAVLARNLREAGVDFLVLNRWPAPNNSPAARNFVPRWARVGKLEPERRIFADKDSEIWDLRQRPGAGSLLEPATAPDPGVQPAPPTQDDQR